MTYLDYSRNFAEEISMARDQHDMQKYSSYLALLASLKHILHFSSSYSSLLYVCVRIVIVAAGQRHGENGSLGVRGRPSEDGSLEDFGDAQ